MSEPRVGLGFDVHGWGAGGTLHLAGVVVPDRAALLGHSDGDVVCHARADALLGAAGLGDIGEHFPESDPAISGIAGLDLLGEAVAPPEDARAARGRPIERATSRPAKPPPRMRSRRRPSVISRQHSTPSLRG